MAITCHEQLGELVYGIFIGGLFGAALRFNAHRTLTGPNL